ncbi:MAG TPA: xanthine dehydrogenase family protein molybdopterin-binding subunit [Hyphomicrobiaceae bacterium]|nr:xanthine dehydrogenase family protein molybdopterin-binding subunit [Hyphomicrobiaceae bacterium]
MKFGLGQSARREEDSRFLRGQGRYTDDINLPNQAWSYILRSPHAHARIRSIDTEAAGRAPGVLAVYTGADIAKAGLGDLPCFIAKLGVLKRPDGQAIFVPPHPALARDKVAFVGDCVAFVVAETREQARDAAELIEIDYDPLPANPDTRSALAEGAPVVWDGCPDNICYRTELGDRAAVDRAFGSAHHVTRIELPMPRVAVNPMEPRAALGAYSASDGRYTLYSGNQMPHDMRHWLASSVLNVPEAQIRIVSPDMGGSFGLRATIFPEIPLVLWAARELGRPVKWVNERSDGILEEQGRDFVMTGELALDREGRFLGLRVDVIGNMGAYLSNFGPHPPLGNIGGVAGVYTTPAIHARVTSVFTNTGPTGAVRGAGRPEATSLIEQIIEKAAREMGIDRVELRRRNIIPPSAMPFQTPLTYNYDCGAFERNMDQALALIDARDFETRRAAAAASGRLLGLGIANTIEQSAGGNDEGGEIRFDRQGHATVLMGTHSHGQGHETVFKQLVSERLGLEFEEIRYVQGDTDVVPYGHGTGGSRVSGLGGSALLGAVQKVVDKGRRIAAHALEVPLEDVDFSDGRFRAKGTNRSFDIKEIAGMAFQPALLPPGMDSGLSGFATFRPMAPTFPNACHVAEVEIDPDTGTPRILRYIAVEDVGTVLNPLLLDGQIHGGIAQGAGHVFGEQVVWDENGQPLTGSFMDYVMPRADDLSRFEIETNGVPTARNPLGVKGAGEAGTVGAVACLTSAVLDALAPLGITNLRAPFTPQCLWRAIKEAKERALAA